MNPAAARAIPQAVVSAASAGHIAFLAEQNPFVAQKVLDEGARGFDLIPDRHRRGDDAPAPQRDETVWDVVFWWTTRRGQCARWLGQRCASQRPPRQFDEVSTLHA